ncbi:10280_t:CDS:2 [Acaulospora morrowiae]|uniref:10280_t:CDS:1 n=1 Tax=Acaulospora morrowiae TaxID=94023 RepID=A0A9N8W530_9GLOM|nr:10280_t:CDS:2 [Acaulospora morrowiae]
MVMNDVILLQICWVDLGIIKATMVNILYHGMIKNTSMSLHKYSGRIITKSTQQQQLYIETDIVNCKIYKAI